MKSNIYLMLEKFFKEPLINIAKKLNYNEANITILENDLTKLQTKYPEVYTALKSCAHNRDGRSEIEYAQDLICSWIFEDYLITHLRLNNLQIDLNGADFERKILASPKIKSTSDYIVNYKNKQAYVELVNDYKGYWLKNKKIDLRDDKYLHLKELSQTKLSLLLGIDFSSAHFFIIKINDNINPTYVPYHFAYKKPVYSLDLSKTVYYDFSFSKVCDIIKNIMEAKNE